MFIVKISEDFGKLLIVNASSLVEKSGLIALLTSIFNLYQQCSLFITIFIIFKRKES